MKRTRIRAESVVEVVGVGPAFDRLDEAVSIIHNLGINDRYSGSAESKLFAVRDGNGEIQWAALARDLEVFDLPQYQTEWNPLREEEEE